LIYAWREKVTERHKKFLNPEEAAAEIMKDLSSCKPEQVKLFANIYVFLLGGLRFILLLHPPIKKLDDILQVFFTRFSRCRTGISQHAVLIQILDTIKDFRHNFGQFTHKSLGGPIHLYLVGPESKHQRGFPFPGVSTRFGGIDTKGP
jgi:hypothetical protein